MVFPSIFRCLTISLSITMIFRLDISNTFLMIGRFSESFNWESIVSDFSFRQLLMSEGSRHSPYKGPILARLRWFYFVFSNADGGSAKSTNGKKRIFTTIQPLMSTPLALYKNAISWTLLACFHVRSFWCFVFIRIAVVPY